MLLRLTAGRPDPRSPALTITLSDLTKQGHAVFIVEIGSRLQEHRWMTRILGRKNSGESVLAPDKTRFTGRAFSQKA